jgi:hypothetical protein
VAAVGEQFIFSLLEKIELIQRIQELETANAKLLKEFEWLRLQNQLLREDLAAYYKENTTPKVVSTDPNGVLLVE